MDVRTFEAMTMKDAVKAVRAEFGVDAVILNTKEVPLQDGLGKSIQVTAARNGGKSLTGASRDQSDFSDQEQHFKARLDTIESRINLISDQIATREQLITVESSILELRSLLYEVLKNKEGSVVHGLPGQIEELYHRLQIAGIDETRLAEVATYLKSLPTPTEDDEEKVKEYFQTQAIRWFLKRIKIAPRWNSIPGSPTVQAFVGSTGAGKTAMVAKLAANIALREKRKVLVVSYDTNRLAATEQLRIYAKIIGVAFEAVDEAKDLEKLLEKYSDVETVLLDTSGRSPKNMNGIKSLQALKKLNFPVDFHLVLSLTERENQHDRCIRNFGALGLQSLIFSKLDESWSYGQVFNLSQRWGLPLSYFGTGQRVPEDLERATRERVVERLFNL